MEIWYYLILRFNQKITYLCLYHEYICIRDFTNNVMDMVQVGY